MAMDLQNFLIQVVKIDKLITLKCLNSKLRRWDFSEAESKDRPPPINETIFKPGSKINMKAVSLYLLAQELPFILESCLPKNYPYLINYVRMLQITQLCMWSTINSDDSVADLRLNLGIHHHIINYYIQKPQ